MAVSTSDDAPTPKTGRHRVMFLSDAGGAAPPQGSFRDREEARRWAGSRKCWVVWEPVLPGEKVRWTVRSRKR